MNPHRAAQSHEKYQLVIVCVKRLSISILDVRPTVGAYSMSGAHSKTGGDKLAGSLLEIILIACATVAYRLTPRQIRVSRLGIVLLINT